MNFVILKFSLIAGKIGKHQNPKEQNYKNVCFLDNLPFCRRH